ncbi:hypothetical protein EGR_07133 [Echinococcus granulosus]|uniref:Uncharacterized protein n=1 Tax=Echinococcus granulosus TaxID=6210 RepID=W6UIS8_ECHGR|nr:hypothetical protein EGR_07133 [Echinococcus granulosus]EUB58027.1 hypothetical protein EGR_07133 [Echinococcus granulosus]
MQFSDNFSSSKAFFTDLKPYSSISTHKKERNALIFMKHRPFLCRGVPCRENVAKVFELACWTKGQQHKSFKANQVGGNFGMPNTGNIQKITKNEIRFLVLFCADLWKNLNIKYLDKLLRDQSKHLFVDSFFALDLWLIIAYATNSCSAKQKKINGKGNSIFLTLEIRHNILSYKCGNRIPNKYNDQNILTPLFFLVWLQRLAVRANQIGTQSSK